VKTQDAPACCQPHIPPSPSLPPPATLPWIDRRLPRVAGTYRAVLTALGHERWQPEGTPPTPRHPNGFPPPTSPTQDPCPTYRSRRAPPLHHHSRCMQPRRERAGFGDITRSMHAMWGGSWCAQVLRLVVLLDRLGRLVVGVPLLSRRVLQDESERCLAVGQDLCHLPLEPILDLDIVDKTLIL